MQEADEKRYKWGEGSTVAEFNKGLSGASKGQAENCIRHIGCIKRLYKGLLDCYLFPECILFRIKSFA
ncbi:MAG TPA: hypothetical protein DDZ89_07150 [Clostridiales bacterium]|nr:hypothetical protein [Clostridiales bacterium]